jgi:hypothetical protein
MLDTKSDSALQHPCPDGRVAKQQNVVAPPSSHESGRFNTWVHGCAPEDIELSELPDWIFTELSKHKAATPNSAWRRLARDGVSEGARNDSIARLSGKLLRHRVDPILALEIMQGWDAGRCRPPLDDSEVSRVVHSIHVRQPARRRAR